MTARVIQFSSRTLSGNLFEPTTSDDSAKAESRTKEAGSTIIVRSAIETASELTDAEANSQAYEVSPVRKLYPHVFDETQVSGQATRHIKRSLEDARQALDAFGEPNLEAVATSLSNVSACLAAAYPLIDFNKSLRSAVGFMRRATLITSVTELTRPALNALVHSLSTISENPMITLAEAAEVTGLLADEGWRGDHDLASKLLGLLTQDCDGVEMKVNANESAGAVPD